jgi:hypothetical protein
VVSVLKRQRTSGWVEYHASKVSHIAAAEPVMLLVPIQDSHEGCCYSPLLSALTSSPIVPMWLLVAWVTVDDVW